MSKKIIKKTVTFLPMLAERIFFGTKTKEEEILWLTK